MAMAASTISAIEDRIDAAASGDGAARTLSLPGLARVGSDIEALVSGGRTLKQVLDGQSFTLRLKGRGGKAGPALWGHADYNDLSGDADGALDWDGHVFSLHLGADIRPRHDLVVGAALSRSQGSFDYADRAGGAAADGRYRSRMTAVHPYAGWFYPNLTLWATAGYGRGEVEIDDDEAGRRQSSDADLKTAAAGGSARLLSSDDLIAGGTTELRLKGEGVLARIDVEGDDLINPLSADARRLRLLLEGGHERSLDRGARLTVSLEGGWRHDGGDVSGAGLELGGGLGYFYPAIGLTVEGRGRVLLAHESDYEEWGVGGLVSLDPGADGLGPSLRLGLGRGDAAGGARRLWDLGLANAPQGGGEDASAARLEAELGYGMPAMHGQGLLTPYGGFSLSDGGARDYRSGLRLELGPALRLDLEGARRGTASAAPEHGLMLHGEIRF